MLVTNFKWRGFDLVEIETTNHNLRKSEDGDSWIAKHKQSGGETFFNNDDGFGGINRTVFELIEKLVYLEEIALNEGID